VHVFADDLKIYLTVRHGDLTDAVLDLSRCQQAIDMVSLVAGSWGLSLNVDKCVVLRFRGRKLDLAAVGALGVYQLNGMDMRCVDCHRDLGILEDVSLRFHIRSIVNKAACLCSNLLRSTRCRSREFMMSLYVAHVRPLLEFGSCVWNTGFVGDQKLLEGVQRRWAKQIDGLSEMTYGQRWAKS
jgi:hypothetical protein